MRNQPRSGSVANCQGCTVASVAFNVCKTIAKSLISVLPSPPMLLSSQNPRHIKFSPKLNHPLAQVQSNFCCDKLYFIHANSFQDGSQHSFQCTRPG